MSCKNTLTANTLALHEHKRPQSHAKSSTFSVASTEEAIRGSLLKHGQWQNGGYCGWTRFRLAVWRLLSALNPPRASTNHLFSAAAERLWQRLAPSKSTLENGPEPAKQLIWTQPGVWMRDLHTASSHPARKLGLCAPHEAPERHRRSPSCARREGKGRVSGLVGRAGAPKRAAQMPTYAPVWQIFPTPLGGKTHISNSDRLADDVGVGLAGRLPSRSD